MWSREISWCVCGNPKAFTHLFILFLLPLHPRIISFPTVYRNRHNHCTFLPSEERQPPLRLQFCSVSREHNTCNPPSITFIPLLDANSPRALVPEVLGLIWRFLPPPKPAFLGWSLPSVLLHLLSSPVSPLDHSCLSVAEGHCTRSGKRHTLLRYHVCGVRSSSTEGAVTVFK